MAGGTVTYQATVTGNSDIYSGPGAKEWAAVQSGSFPSTPYVITSASISYDVETPGWNTDGSGRSFDVYGSGAQLGSCPCGTAGSQTAPLSTGASYEGITSIKLDGGTHWVCTIKSGSAIMITVEWEDDEPEETDPQEEEDPLKEPVDVVTGTIRSDGARDTVMHTEPIVAFEGVDISDEIKQFLISLSFTDNEEDETDDLQIKLQDAAGVWLHKWLNASLQASISGGTISLGGKTKGLKIKAGIRCSYPGGVIRQTDCGEFTLDSFKASGPPSTITIKASSLPYAAGVRTEERDKAWEEYTLSGIGGEIAGRAGLGFMYDCNSDPFYKRLEQAKETDISFLQRLCHDAGYSLKVSDSRLIIFDQAKYEALSAVLTISWMDGTYTKYDLSTNEGDVTFARCEVRYYDPDRKETIIGTATTETFDAEDENNQTLVITDHKVTTIGEASELAAQLLRLHNKFEREISFTLVGNPLLAAGLNVELSGFGMWDGKYLLKQVKHEVTSTGGYTTKIKGRCVYAHQTVKTGKEEKDKKSSGSSSQSQQKQDGEPYWALSFTSTVFSAPPGQSGSESLGTQSAGTEITILGSTKGGYTLVSVGGVTGYISTGAIKKQYK